MVKLIAGIVVTVAVWVGCAFLGASWSDAAVTEGSLIPPPLVDEAQPDTTPIVFLEPPAEILAWGLLMLHREQVKLIYYYDTETVYNACTDVGWTNYPDIGCFVPVENLHCDILLNDNLNAQELLFATEGLLAMCAYYWYGERWDVETP